MLIILFLVSHFNFLFVPCGGLSWLPVSFLLHVKYTLSYRIDVELAVTPYNGRDGARNSTDISTRHTVLQQPHKYSCVTFSDITVTCDQLAIVMVRLRCRQPTTRLKFGQRALSCSAPARNSLPPSLNRSHCYIQT